MPNVYKTAAVSFTLGAEIGTEGRNSQAFMARDHQLDADIVIKQVDKNALTSEDDFFAESRALYASAHSNVVQVHYACEDDDYVYVAMPFYRNGSLKKLINSRHLTVREIVVLSSQVLSGLHNIHSKGLIHFDIKPDNILLSDRGEALLSDFGLAKFMDNNNCASPDQMYGLMIPPEAASEDEFTRTFDIYQFGLTLYRMCNGNDVFYRQVEKYIDGEDFDRDTFEEDIANGRFPDRSVFQPHIPARLRNIIKCCINVNKNERYSSALDIANAMADIDGNILDWQYVEDGDKRHWVKNIDRTEVRLSVMPDGSSQCVKSVDGKPGRRVSAGCRVKITEREIQQFLKDN